MSLLSELLGGQFDDVLGRRLDRMFSPTWSQGSLLIGDNNDSTQETERRDAAPGGVTSWGPDRGWQSFIRAPRLDLLHQGDSYVVRVDVPGIQKEELVIDADEGNVLSISGERAADKEVQGEEYYRKERSFGRFQRRVRLPQDGLLDQAKAELRDGVLTLTIPKRQQEETKKRIEIN